MILDNLHSLKFFLPELALTAGILLVILSDIALKGLRNRLNPLLTMVTLLLAAWFTFQLNDVPAASLFHGMLAIDGLAQFFKLLLLLAAALVVLGSLHSTELASVHQGEFFALLLAVTLGMVLLANSTHLAMLYLSLELVSLASYIMVGYLKTDRLSNEASLKYILFGAISTGSMLYGLSLVYGMTGSLSLYTIRDAFLNQAPEGVSQFTILLILVLTMAGFGFKTAVVPFHFWCPDVYAGAPTPVTAFLSVAPKAAGFAVLLRFFFSGMSQANGTHWELIRGIDWPLVLIGLSVLTMTLGNIAALTQNNLKRMLAYSSIAHAGYILMGSVVLTGDGVRAILVYLFVYLFMNLGAFLVVTIIYNSDKTFDIEDYNGMFKRSPFVAVAMAVFMLSLIGIPPFSGFMGKLYVFGSVIDKGLYWFAAIGALNAAVAAFYYMRVMKAMLIEESNGSPAPLQISFLNQALLVALLLPNVLLVIFWDPIDRWTSASARLFGGI
ncbi:MAG: NADH-quinone oxidoreductase subunit N [Acidimicrobiia bacterium]|nr:NADH-quinone oxidoreductase subunit N [Acidimicrobiia bacterium]